MTLTEMWIVATAILLAGMVDDLRSRKVHNSLILFFLPIAIGCNFYFRGWEGSAIGLSALLGALVLTVPLFMLGAFGGGDVKLFAVFALCVDPSTMFWTLLYSVIWGALFGLVRAAMQKQLMTLVRSTYKVASRHKNAAHQPLHTVPYTFSLLLGWFTQLTFMHAGGLL